MPAIKNWKVNEEAVAAMLRQDGVAQLLRDQGELGAQAARDIAPVRTGRYRDSIHVLEPHEDSGALVGGFGTDDYKWHFIEFGTVHNETFRVLSRAAELTYEHLELQ